MSDSKSRADKYKELLDERDRLAEELNKVKSALALVPDGNEELSPEFNIAELELRRLQERAIQGSLSLEDIKKYDILVKNKRLVQNKSTSNSLRRDVNEVIDITELTRLAGGHIIEEEIDEEDN